ncbi:DUF3168 domain-containing protein [Pseudovibrio sp. Tun.PSC04-5.I4]|uniref:DUF3168 domain-containing protein n=1 Tax=Pseudovibrio sp. Tun.PSC04-5.I4 TaxID=1798213 RepID=UPI00088DC461|nr:DUF3168 domain-containing protein [Pseudovibrio sp. Tun.PSC04-5.I4]SDR19902.1 Protein of unknown function [Pseudovibrio sp. Tun.PSC04-5.I4]
MTGYAVDLQRRLFNALIDAGSAAKSVIDHPSSDVKDDQYPFIVIGEWQTIPNDVTGAHGSYEYVDVHIWSRAHGQSETKEIIAKIYGNLHDADFAVEGLSSCFSFIESTRVMSDPDGNTRHGVITVKFHCRKA